MADNVLSGFRTRSVPAGQAAPAAQRKPGCYAAQPRESRLSSSSREGSPWPQVL
jgi:hypothetical protein